MPLVNKMHMLLLLIYSIAELLFTSAVPIAVYFLVLYKVVTQL